MNNATASSALYGNHGNPVVAEKTPSEFVFKAETQDKPKAATESNNDPAAVLYGGEPRQVPKEAEPRNETPEQAKERVEENLYGQGEIAELPIPDEIKAERDADQARKLYSPQVTYSKVIPDAIFEGDVEIAKMPANMQRAVVAEVREMAQDLGMTTDDVQVLRSVGLHCDTNPANEATRQAWRAEATQRLTAIYGAGADVAYQDAMKFVQRDSRFSKALAHGGRGDHPDAVVLFAKLAQQAKSKGRLK